MIYFDAAATTLQKPPQVAQAVAHAIGRCASPGRGDHASTRLAERVLFQCREAVMELFDAENPEQVVFCMNATHALNIAIRTLVRPGSRVAISCWEHNAVTRTIASVPGVEVLIAQAPLFDDEATVQAFAEIVAQKPDVVICTWVSNVFGYILPIRRIDRLCAQHGIPLIIDASQAAGTVDISARELSAKFIAFPGHKGLYGPQGTGVLLCGDQLPEPLLTGGTGGDSLRRAMPGYLPDRVEAGTHNVAGIAGLLEGVRYVQRVGTQRIRDHEKELLREAVRGFKGLEKVRVFCSESDNQSGVMSLFCEGIDCQTLAAQLARRGIAVRAGLHCAPLAHQSGGTVDRGTVRMSFSAFNTRREIDAFFREFQGCIHRKLT